MARRAEYVYGSAARQYAPAPKKEAIERVQVRNNAQKSVHMSLPYGIFLVAALIFAAAILVQYVQLQSDIISNRKHCASLQNEYEDLRLSNDLYYDSIMSSVDIREIERIAVEELGMRLAGEGQIITYSGDIEDYVRQYEDIPE